MTLLNATTQGTGNSGRVGRIATITSVQARMTFQSSVGATGINPVPNVRVLIVYDKEANGVATTAAAILATDNVVAPMNLENAQRYIILADSGLLTGDVANGGGLTQSPTASSTMNSTRSATSL